MKQDFLKLQESCETHGNYTIYAEDGIHANGFANYLPLGFVIRDTATGGYQVFDASTCQLSKIYNLPEEAASFEFGGRFI